MATSKIERNKLLMLIRVGCLKVQLKAYMYVIYDVFEYKYNHM